MELVLKTSDPARDRGFESHPLRHKQRTKFSRVISEMRTCVSRLVPSGSEEHLYN